MQQADRAARLLRMGEVVCDIGMRVVEAAAAGVVSVSLLGDRQRDPARACCGDPVYHQAGIFACDEQLSQRTDHAGAGADRIALDQRVVAVLRRQGIPRIGRAQADTANAPAGGAAIHRFVQVGGLVCSKEIAHAQMDHADSGGLLGVGRPADLCGQLLQCGGAQPLHERLPFRGGERHAGHVHAAPLPFT
jgi:hypothetical protein